MFRPPTRARHHAAAVARPPRLLEHHDELPLVPDSGGVGLEVTGQHGLRLVGRWVAWADLLDLGFEKGLVRHDDGSVEDRGRQKRKPASCGGAP